MRGLQGTTEQSPPTHAARTVAATDPQGTHEAAEQSCAAHFSSAQLSCQRLSASARSACRGAHWQQLPQPGTVDRMHSSSLEQALSGSTPEGTALGSTGGEPGSCDGGFCAVGSAPAWSMVGRLALHAATTAIRIENAGPNRDSEQPEFMMFLITCPYQTDFGDVPAEPI